MDAESILKDLNTDAPTARRTLSEHIASGDLTYRMRSGRTCAIGREEIDALCAVCTEHEKMTLRLPITVTADASLSQNVWKIEGCTEVSVISKLISRRPVKEDLIHLYHPHLSELRKILPNSVFIMFIP